MKGERETLNRDAAKSETTAIPTRGGRKRKKRTRRRRKEIPLSEAESRRLTRDINFSLKLARQDSPREREERPRTPRASRQHDEEESERSWRGEREGAGEKHAGGMAGGDQVKKKAAAVATKTTTTRTAGEKCRGETRCASPWRGASADGASPWRRERRSPFSRRGSNYGGRSDSHLRALYHRPS